LMCIKMLNAFWGCLMILVLVLAKQLL